MEKLEFKGTKGKWEYRSNGRFFEVNPHVANITTASKFEIQKSNAKLIAAAPELLEALKLFIDPLTGLVDDTVAKHIGNKNAHLIEQAIEKALK